MTEEQNKLADRLEGMLQQVGHPDYSLTEFYEGLKLIVWELRQEREPATEAVLGTMSEVTAPVIAAPGAFNLSEFVNAADIGGADSPHQIVYKLQRAINAALKGKGASQGVDELMCPMTAQVCYDPRAQCKPGYCRRQLAPESSGEFVRVPREPTEAQRHLAMMNDSPSYRKDSLTFYREMLAASPDEQKG